MANSATLRASIEALNNTMEDWVFHGWGGVPMETYYAVEGVISSIIAPPEEKRPSGRIFLGNSFSLQMVAPSAIVCIEECSPEDVPESAVSCIGHSDTAAVVSGILGREVPCNRTSISLEDGDVLYVAQLTGGRLPEGATKLPEGFSLKFRRVVVRC